ncbi:MAG: hypothetical protein K5931_06930 [Lachnospiraceae bacterium]|nr:hypothetical protein [Lachnospiraceae bacterium]
MDKLTLIIPCKKEDYERMTQNFSDYFEFFPIKEIILIGSLSLSKVLDKEREEGKFGDLPVRFLDEEELVSYDKMVKAVEDHLAEKGYKIDKSSRLGCYYQQFLKMKYSEICQDEYYMTWDIDTIPLRKKEIFDEKGHPYFDMKNEYQPGYFKTIEKLLGLKKMINKSFISEHMVFKKEYMKEIIDIIMKYPVKGESFYEKIMYSIDLDNLKLGFSEFESYGTYVGMKHPESYKLREWYSLRKGGFFTTSDKLDEATKSWLAGSFDAITFEAYNSINPELEEMFNNDEYRNGLSAMEFYKIALEGGLFGVFTEEGLIKDDLYTRWPY